jgi:hypothetical protein
MSYKDLNIPESLNQWYLDNGWFNDYWMELPVNWVEWNDTELKRYPITNVILDWKKSQKSSNKKGVKNVKNQHA